MATQLGEETIKTYRYVRVSMVAAVFLLFIALIIQVIRDNGIEAGSVSAYYYSPARSVFVGTLVGAAFSLIAIRGRPGGEDELLNLAGMLLPLVAFIPTPIPSTPDDPCTSPALKCIPPEFVPGVEVSVAALFFLGALGLAFAFSTLKGRNPADRGPAFGFVAAFIVWAGFGIWFGPTSNWPTREGFLANAHYASAIPLFGLLIVVAFINALKSDGRIHIARFEAPYKGVYKSVAVAMTAVLIGALIYWAVVIREEPDAKHVLLFWVEVALLALFAVFWIAQTAEFSREGLPVEAREGAGQVPAAGER